MTNQKAPVSIALVDDDRGLRESLRILVSESEGFQCVGAYGSAEEAFRSLDTRSAAPDVLLLDIRLPGEPGSRAVRRFVDRFPGLAVIMLTLYAEDELIFEALCNGASGYLLKKTPPGRILEAATEAHGGGAPMSPEVARRVVQLFRTFPAPAATSEARLTPQETRFLSHLSQGYSYQAAADDLEVSVNTVRNYVRAIYEKLHVHSRSEAVGKALRAGLI
ncbi:MAG: response regulator transcription factor [Acidobacteria bacterium]|nr:response regulator transcription factor [Acidobacteriota bacterium]